MRQKKSWKVSGVTSEGSRSRLSSTPDEKCASKGEDSSAADELDRSANDNDLSAWRREQDIIGCCRDVRGGEGGQIRQANVGEKAAEVSRGERGNVELRKTGARGREAEGFEGVWWSRCAVGARGGEGVG